MASKNKLLSDQQKKLHYHKLENAYYTFPNNTFFDPILNISDGRAEVRINVLEKHYHFFGAAYGFLYFKVLDDASFYSANSLEFEKIY